ncbi:leucyl aminopeptidase family protein [Xanthomonas translucens]|uniref:leucyl aminopeptidase family protein n=1 Tax=Xanthomonas campestris pv. translucens TaxID=343 RepID=UPI00071E7422|nr:leucyl aminopeptidase family protein [Xanthomonas translucens]KTF40223.1 cytochrome C oxidase subunit II [Xanthomonas translucens pv. translucens]MCT8275072.1 leucyl aminopeptidase family protein [Xanthomonas translucens pv. translucens]MCT8278873.1 leucyl aminopeptidase family protein [Xanthomonas translucens pv. translucens]MCT8306683.1 leucyl aminopeptidase family protein [Xanthomonas translucens pv. translucens]WNJ25399.1 leucyl aminopeptidase family protein [Xanthomonas translucens pv.
MSLPSGFTDAAPRALPLHVLDRERLAEWRAAQAPAWVAWLDAQQFVAAPGTALLLPGADGVAAAVLGVGDRGDAYAYAHAPLALPAGSSWQLASALSEEEQAALHLGWGLGSYRFTRYKQPMRLPAQLLATPSAEVCDQLQACLRVRDWVNTPAEDMGPEQLEAAARAIAEAHGAQCESIVGEDLLSRHFPAIHAVGRASHRAPRLIVLRWGEDTDPHVALVGKGVCFDTGGLDLKPADGMRHMKKDMGGAAHALALAGLVMAQRLPLRLTVLLAAVENAVGPHAFRPGDVIATRQGISVEIDNTDAEGRLVLCDALAYASEQTPDAILDFATLTGAARVALGPDLPALFCNDDALAQAWIAAGERSRDPVWRMPLWRPYLRYLTSPIADLANAGSRMAGAVTAALYLERFVPARQPWAHLDVYAWNDSDRHGRPAGGEALALRSAYAMLKARYAG